MKDGLYKAEFTTPLGTGGGVIFLSSGTVRGGDSSMYYVGTFEESAGQFTANLHVQKHFNIPGLTSVFGLNDVHVNLSGTSTDDSAIIQGTALEAPTIQFHARITRLCD